MTTVILVIIGILLAAAAVLMMIWYGSDGFGDARVKAEAARLVGEGAQVSYAMDLYQRQEEKRPGGGSDGTAALNELLAEKYLTDVPKGVDAADGKWRIDYEAGIIRSSLGPAADEENLEVCHEARRQLSLPEADTKIYACDGSDYPSGKLSEREPCCIG